MSLLDLGDETLDWLSEWMANTGNDRYEMHSMLTQSIIDELRDFMHEHNEMLTFELYRGTQHDFADGTRSYDTVTSWSHEFEMAELFAPNVMQTVVDESNVLIDTTLFKPRDIRQHLGGFPDEVEVILLPGNYKIWHAS